MVENDNIEIQKDGVTFTITKENQFFSVLVDGKKADQLFTVIPKAETFIKNYKVKEKKPSVVKKEV